jgi:hypothetical protein
MIPIAARSFTLPPGFRYSSLAKTSAEPTGAIRFNLRIGVSPTSWVISSATRGREGSVVVFCTLQVTEAERSRQSTPALPCQSSIELIIHLFLPFLKSARGDRLQQALTRIGVLLSVTRRLSGRGTRRSAWVAGSTSGPRPSPPPFPQRTRKEWATRLVASVFASANPDSRWDGCCIAPRSAILFSLTQAGGLRDTLPGG